nr:helicase-associated domain-containing protein [Gemmatimonadota bacterium]
DGFIRIDAFIDYGTREDNPLLAQANAPSGKDPGLVFYSGYSDPRGSAREMWGTMLGQFLTNRLLAFGGATLGIDDTGGVCFSLSDVGLYLLGATDSFEYGAGVAAGDVVVQPNFDVVFLGAAPAVEAELARFCERVGVAPGHVFRITRASILAAAESGASAGDVVGALTRASSRPIPKNVQHEIAGWMAVVRRATLRRTELLECSDAEVAARVVGILGASVRQLTPVLLELPGLTPAARASMLKKLRAGGVFISAS